MTESGESRNCDQSPDSGRGNLGSVNTPVLTMHRDRLARKQIKVHLDFLEGNKQIVSDRVFSLSEH